MLEIKEEELKKVIPSEGPSIDEVKKYLEKYNDEYIVIKCGGSVLVCLLYTSPSPRDRQKSRMPSSA